MIDGGSLGNAGFKYLGVPYSQMDCQAFVEKCLSDCGLHKDLAGSNAWYREVMAHGWVGTPEDCVKMLGKVPDGAFLFIWAQDGGEPAKYKPDGIGNASHIGLCTGIRGNGAIHSSASRGCVAESEFHGKTIKNGGWNRVGLWDQVAYDYSGADGQDPLPDPTPATMTATVYAENGKPVNLRTRPSRAAALVDRIPCGETVDVLEYGNDWSKIKWHNKTGYMMTPFLLFEDADTEILYCVTIHDLPKALAEEIANTYGGSITEERG